jgi:hypothetical protein
MNAEPLRILVVVSRPLAQLVPLEHEGQKFVAVKPVAPEPIEAVRDGLRRVFLDDKTPGNGPLPALGTAVGLLGGNYWAWLPL